MKKIISTVSALALCGVVAFGVSGCGQKAATQTLEVSMNPEVTFILDANNVVQSVTFEDQATNQIFAEVNFVGQDINGAMQLFVNYSLISGHVLLNTQNFVDVTGTAATDAQITALQDHAKQALKTAFENIGITTNAVINTTNQTLTQAKVELRQQLSELAPELTDFQLYSMSVEELTQKIKDKLNVYAGMTYEQIQQVKTELSSFTNQLLVSAVEAAKGAVELAEETLGDIVDKNSPEYKNAIAYLNQQKTAFNKAVADLQAKIQELANDVKTQLNNSLQTLKNGFKSEVQAAKTSVESYLDTAVQSDYMTEAYAQKIKDLIAQYYTPAA